MGQPVVHFEIIGTEPEKLRSYYDHLFGWKFDTSGPVSEAVSQPGNYGFVDRGTTSDGIPFSGYEMHMGLTEGPDRARPFARLFNGSSEGAVSADGRVSGTYIHGLFADDRQRSAWLQRFGVGQTAIAYDALVDETLDRLAAHLAAHIDLDRLLSLSR